MTAVPQPTPPEWQAWADGKGRCPYCQNLPDAEFRAVCDCDQYEREQEAKG